MSSAIVSIERVRQPLAEIKFDEVRSSPAKRALLTAKLLSEKPVKSDERLAEWNFGELEGCLITDAIARYPREMFTSRNDLVHFDGSIFGAESVSSVLARFDELANELISSRFENVLLVGHGASGTAGIRHLAGFPVGELRSGGGLGNNTVTILEYINGKFHLLVWNKSYDE